MKTSDFYFDLPQELIAQDPLEDRSASRLLVLDKKTGAMEHRHFYNIVDYLQPGRLSGHQQHEGHPGTALRRAGRNRSTHRDSASEAEGK